MLQLVWLQILRCANFVAKVFQSLINYVLGFHAPSAKNLQSGTCFPLANALRVLLNFFYCHKHNGWPIGYSFLSLKRATVLPTIAPIIVLWVLYYSTFIFSHSQHHSFLLWQLLPPGALTTPWRHHSPPSKASNWQAIAWRRNVGWDLPWSDLLQMWRDCLPRRNPGSLLHSYVQQQGMKLKEMRFYEEIKMNFAKVLKL